MARSSKKIFSTAINQISKKEYENIIGQRAGYYFIDCKNFFRYCDIGTRAQNYWAGLIGTVLKEVWISLLKPSGFPIYLHSS